MTNNNLKPRAYAYLRVSSEEKNIGDSTSIQNQRTIIKQYCEQHGIILLREFVDDGFSGARYDDRPGFQKMLQSLDKHEASMVITKDLSRLGRDLQTTLYFTEQYFPEHEIKFFAIYDNFDSTQSNLYLPFMLSSNDLTVRLASQKVRASLQSLRSEGKCHTAPCYGYMKAKNDKYKLVPDPNTAPIVKMIFSLSKDGCSCRRICEILSEKHIIPPLAYRIERGDHFTPKGAAHASDTWNNVTVRRILQNRTYLGEMVQGKTKKLSYKSKKKVQVPKEDWVVHKNMHEPLVSEADFELVQRFITASARDWRKLEDARVSIFAGIVKCGCCGAAMCSGGGRYKGNKKDYWYLTCNNLVNKVDKPIHCEHPARIKYDYLLEVVTKELNELIEMDDKAVNQIIATASKMHTEGSLSKEELVQEIANLKKRNEQIDDIIAKLYRDNYDGKISDERLSKMVASFETENLENLQKIESFEHSDEKTLVRIENYKKFFGEIRKVGSFTKSQLTYEIVHTFIEKITVDERIIPEGRQACGPHTPFEQIIHITYYLVGDLKGQLNQPIIIRNKNADPEDYESKIVS